MSYKVKSTFLTFQGEGYKAGTLAVFVRFSGCNFWSGLEKHRFTRSLCPFCDTDFRGTDGPGGGTFAHPNDLAAHARAIGPTARLVVCTGGEPLLQVDEPLVRAFHDYGFDVSVETNGSIPLGLGRRGIDWVCCSPKSFDKLAIERDGPDELKVIFPAQDPLAWEERFTRLRYKWVQPEDGAGDKMIDSGRACMEFIKANPSWRISVQGHKFLGVP